jgi:quercetin dioxygenase-like cupin family protein
MLTRSREPNQIIARGEGKDPYLFRWMLGRKMAVPMIDNGKADGLENATWVPSEIENVFLHKFIRSDEEDPHSHPWGNTTLVVSGNYDEDVYILEDGKRAFIGRFTRNTGDVVVRSPNAIHAIVRTSEDCMTLFVTGPKEQDWGFYIGQSDFIPEVAYTKNSVLT